MRNRLGVVVPYRNRHTQLTRFLPHMISYLNSSGVEFTIIIVEQDDAKPFNRGMLCNIGFLEAQKQKCNRVVFHDIDMLPIEVDYSYSEHPVHLASNIPFESYFGGITMFPTETFSQVNGFSNLYWGWGFEDDDLRYRCVKNGIKFAKEPDNIAEATEVSPIFNGVDAYAEVPNMISFSRDFNIKVTVKLDRLAFDHTKASDVFPIMSIKGNDFMLSYSSFNRFYLQLFDQNGSYHDLYSEIVTNSVNEIEIDYSRANKKLTLSVNGEPNGELELPYQIHRYSRSEPIFFGTDPTLTSFFKGTIDKVEITNNENELVRYVNNVSKGYRFTDLTGNSNHATLHSVYFDKFNPPVNYYGYIPFRRSSKIRHLYHSNNGFNGGRWKDDLTRWNQLRYNNEVQTGGHDKLDDGLSNCSYIPYSKTKNRAITHLTVGI